MSSDDDGVRASSERGPQNRTAALLSTRAFLQKLDPKGDDRLRGLRDAALDCLHDSGESLIIRASTGSDDVILRLRNPSPLRRSRGFPLGKRYELYQRMCEANPALEVRFPRLLRFEPDLPCIFEEFVDTQPLRFDDPRELRQVIGTIRAINCTPVTPDLHRLLHRRSEEGGLGWYLPKWLCRLASSIVPPRVNPHAARHVLRACRLSARAAQALWWGRLEYPRRLTFHFDGGHAGNFLRRRNGGIVVLDLDRASIRRDPTFTLVRFLASVCRDKPDPLPIFRHGVSAYLGDTPRPGFLEMALCRWLEQEVSELVWVIRETVAGGGPFAEDDVERRCRTIDMLLRRFATRPALTRSRQRVPMASEGEPPAPI